MTKCYLQRFRLPLYMVEVVIVFNLPTCPLFLIILLLCHPLFTSALVNSTTTLSLPCPSCRLPSVILCCSPCSLNQHRQPEVSVFLYIDLSIFNGPIPPRAGTIVRRFRWASDAVRACCHSVLLRERADDLGSALRAFPGGTDMSISPGPTRKTHRELQMVFIGQIFRGKNPPKNNISMLLFVIIAVSQSRQTFYYKKS